MVHLFVHLCEDGLHPRKGVFTCSALDFGSRSDYDEGLGGPSPSDQALMIGGMQNSDYSHNRHPTVFVASDEGRGMTTEPLKNSLDAQLPDLERQAEELERKAHAIRQIIAGVRTLNGDATEILTRRSFEAHRTSFEIAPQDKKGPRGPKAVLKVMQDAPYREWKVIEVKREMLRRGWAPTPKAVEASIKRLREEGQIEPTTYGHYKLALGGGGQVTELPKGHGRDGHGD